MEDMYEMQHCNLLSLPENYNLRYYFYHILSWPQLLYVQVDYDGHVVGYVLGKMDDEEDAAKAHGHITSLAVQRSHRKLGIASRTMRATMAEMDGEYGANFCSLHVRKTNDAALHLYQDTLGYRCAGVEENYYMDEEDAYHMKRYFHKENTGSYVDEHKHLLKHGAPGAPSPNGDGTATAAAEAGGKKGGKTTAKDVQSEMERLLEELGEGSGKGGKGAKGGKPGGKQAGGGGGGGGGGKKGKK